MTDAAHVPDAGLGARVTAFLYAEARLADTREYDAWLGLWDTTDVLYWMPTKDGSDPASTVCFIYDDRTRLEQRVARLSSGFAWSQDPPSLTNRIIGNVEVEQTADDEVTVAANQWIFVSRRGHQSVLSGRVSYLLLVTDDAIRIKRKKVVLVDPDVPVGNITFVL
jgi:benzoate/toluate 1,2-dioxygenase beta subunit